MLVEVYMPKLGMTMKEGTIQSWLKEEGETVSKDEAIVEISSEKITNVIEAPVDGVLEKILYSEDDVVEVGAVIAYINEENEEDESKIEAEIKATPNNVENKDEIISGDDQTEYEVTPLTPRRKAISERMAESLRRSPQGTITTRADMSELIALKNKYASQGKKVTFTDLFIKISSIALLSNPLINSSVKDGMVYTYKYTHIGVGVGTEEALLVPVIKNAEKKGVLEISQDLKDLTQKIKVNNISLDEMSGATFTISNLGMYDVDVITPIINPPESCILAIGSTRQKVEVIEDGQMGVKPMTTLSLTADHTIIDGIQAVNFLTTIKRIMQNPEKYLI